MPKDKLFLPDKELLKKTGDVDYYHWSYIFPIKYVINYRFHQVRKLLGNKKYNRLLEIGTGSGIFLPELSKHCDELFACDIHQEFAQIKALCEKYGIKKYNLSNQSIEMTNFPDESFDVIVATSVLEFIPDLKKAVTEIKRIMRKDGIFITTCPMESKLLDFFLSFYTRKSPKEEFVDSRQKVSTILEKNFTIVEKGYMTPLLGKIFPVYTHYKLKKSAAHRPATAMKVATTQRLQANEVVLGK